MQATNQYKQQSNFREKN